MHPVKCLLRSIFWLSSSWVLLHLLITTADGLLDTTEPADCLVVLGNTVNADGSLSARLQARLDKALELYKAGVSPLIFVSGGLGKEGHYEGTAMQRYLVAKGVPSMAIVVDNAGNNTLATARNFARIAHARNLSSALVVTQFFHVTRTKLLLRQQGIATVEGAHAEYVEWRDVYALLREFFAYYAYRLA
ncbi:YdcF family protein [Hymenobacter taeanensis]|uniref:YdcF family protein n=1 Tax=Hymenobacter taeanensis TaxID=2735321 RepID=A0A6M6BLN4_9BACT|nr:MULTISPECIES: YdcF family protein [Hymenobacter]QJX48840.1 YdcF family protein [Hymenobacter taeanensis]UOQ81648.1 YdcF family protein [Hymenobacter sp. 5414T-23]